MEETLGIGDVGDAVGIEDTDGIGVGTSVWSMRQREGGEYQLILSLFRQGGRSGNHYHNSSLSRTMTWAVESRLTIQLAVLLYDRCKTGTEWSKNNYHHPFIVSFEQIQNSCFATEEGVNEGLHTPRALPGAGTKLVGNVGVLVVGRNVGSGVGVRLLAIQHRRVRCQGRWEAGEYGKGMRAEKDYP